MVYISVFSVHLRPIFKTVRQVEYLQNCKAVFIIRQEHYNSLTPKTAQCGAYN